MLGSHYNDNLYHYQCRELYSNHEVISNNKIGKIMPYKKCIIGIVEGNKLGPKKYYEALLTTFNTLKIN